MSYSFFIDFVRGVHHPRRLPPCQLPEIVFAGASNVGKSSLINAIVGQNIARTSKTPGRTQQINFFLLCHPRSALARQDILRQKLFDHPRVQALDERGAYYEYPEDKALQGAHSKRRGLGAASAFIVDVPGYGYARVAQKMRATWQRLLERYFRNRPSLLRVYVLMDGRHDLKASDAQMVTFLIALSVPFQVVFTKCDQSSTAQLNTKTDQLEAHIKEGVKKGGLSPVLNLPPLQTSARKKMGLEDIQHLLRGVAQPNSKA